MYTRTNDDLNFFAQKKKNTVCIRTPDEKFLNDDFSKTDYTIQYDTTHRRLAAYTSETRKTENKLWIKLYRKQKIKSRE